MQFAENILGTGKLWDMGWETAIIKSSDPIDLEKMRKYQANGFSAVHCLPVPLDVLLPSEYSKVLPRSTDSQSVHLIEKKRQAYIFVPLFIAHA